MREGQGRPARPGAGAAPCAVPPTKGPAAVRRHEGGNPQIAEPGEVGVLRGRQQWTPRPGTTLRAAERDHAAAAVGRYFEASVVNFACP